MTVVFLGHITHPPVLFSFSAENFLNVLEEFLLKFQTY